MLSEKRQLTGINLSIHEKSPCNRAGAGEVKTMSISDLVLDYTMSFASWWVIWELWTGDPLYAWRRQIKFMKNIKSNIQNRIKHFR